MAYGDSGSDSQASTNGVTFKGFSSRADQQNFKIYDRIKQVVNCKLNCSNNTIKSKKIFDRNIFYR